MYTQEPISGAMAVWNHGDEVVKQEVNSVNEDGSITLVANNNLVVKFNRNGKWGRGNGWKFIGFEIPEKDTYPIPDYTGNSFVDALKSIGVDACYLHRQRIAEKNNLQNYLGLGSQNKELWCILMAGNLKIAD